MPALYKQEFCLLVVSVESTASSILLTIEFLDDVASFGTYTFNPKNFMFMSKGNAGPDPEIFKRGGCWNCTIKPAGILSGCCLVCSVQNLE